MSDHRSRIGIHLFAIALCVPLASQAAQDLYFEAKAAMPTPRRLLGVAVLNDRVYAVGGAAGVTDSDLLEVYDPSTNTWSTRTSMKYARSALAAAAAGGTVYAIGGMNYGSVVEAYDPATDTWKEKTSMPTGRDHHAAVEAGGSIYVIGGASSGSVLATVEVYDPATDAWVTKTPMPTARSHLLAVAIGGAIYAIGGTSEPTPLSVVEAYDVATDTWTAKASMPTARFGAYGAVVEGVIYTLGGATPSVGSYVEAYDPLLETWSVRADMPNAGFCRGAGRIGGTVFIAGGYSDTLHSAAPTSLACSVAVSPAVIGLGQTCEVALTVRNDGATSLTGVVSDPFAVTFPGYVEVVSGPNPSQPATLSSGETKVFTWGYRAISSCILTFSTWVSGVDSVTGQTKRTNVRSSNALQITTMPINPGVTFGPPSTVPPDSPAVYPNPLRGDVLTVGLLLRQDAREVETEILDLGFRRVCHHVESSVGRGYARIPIAGMSRLAPGKYFVRVTAALASGGTEKNDLRKLVIRR